MTSRKIRGWDAHSGIDGLGQNAGSSFAESSTTGVATGNALNARPT
jgi:hypothetical protein